MVALTSSNSLFVHQDAYAKYNINERNAEISRDRNMLIAMDPQLAQAFNNSTAISRKYSK